MKNFFLLFIASVFILTSCGTNDDFLEQSNEVGNNSTESRSDCRYPILDNSEYDLLGKGHNELLEQAMNILALQNESISISSIQNVFRHLDIPGVQFTNSEIEGRLEDYYFEIINKTLNEPPSKLLPFINDLDYIFNSTSNFNELSNLLNHKIEEIGNDININNDLRIAAKGFFTVAKYSAEFWLPESAGGSGIGYTYLLNTGHINSEDDVIQALSIAKADAIGAAGGMLEWCGAAILGGPVGVAGFVGGAIFGAAFASAVTGMGGG